MRRYSSHLVAPILLSLTPTALGATPYQGINAASCSIYEICEDEICINVSLPFSSILLTEDSGEYHMTNSIESYRAKLGYFNSFDEAQEFVSRAEERDFGAVIIPNDEISDASGLSYYAVVSGRGTYLSEHVTKLICSTLRFD